MNEAIGAKGGKRDRKRSLIISQNKKKKLIQEREDKELRELEKRVKKKQVYTLIKTLPIVIGGGTVKTVVDVASNRPKKDLEEENSKWRIKEYDGDITSKTPDEVEEDNRRKRIITTSTGKKVIVYVSNDLVNEDEKSIDEDNKADENIDFDREPNKVRDDNKKSDINLDESNNKKDTSNIGNKPISVGVSSIGNNESKKVDDLTSLDLHVLNDLDYSDIDLDNLPVEMHNKLQQLKSRKIIDEYEKQLKDIRYDLRKLIYEYNVLVDEDEKVILSKEAEVILDKLSDIITRIEVLKSKLKVEDLDKYDDNYLYLLIEGYLNEFRDGKIVSEIKDSPLYVMISEKLNELDSKRDKLDKKVSDKKDELKDKEKSFEDMKKKYYSLDELNKELEDFQKSQDSMLEEIRKKIDNATSESEKVVYEFQGMNKMTKRMLRMLSFQMFLPGPRFAKGMAASAAANLYFINRLLKPNYKSKKVKVITVKDYSSDIENNIDKISDAINLLGKTSRQIDIMISEIYDKYKDYFGVIKECDEMISNLYKMKSDLEEKEYEMEKLKKQQELELERNNAKVKTIGEYPVN